MAVIEVGGLTKRYEAGRLPWSPDETVTAVDGVCHSLPSACPPRTPS